ncbi:MAG: ATP-binding protein, partial [bacterium]
VELEAESLMVSLKELTQKTQALTGVSCRFECPTPILITDNNVATHLYRIAQEAVNNAVRHGQAKNVEVELIQGESRITLIVRDDGKGISSEKKKTRGIGMHIMRYRARMIEGDLEFSDNGERGTRLVCTLPIPKEEN